MQITLIEKNLMMTATMAKVADIPTTTVGTSVLTVPEVMPEVLMIGEKITVVGLLQQWRMVLVLQLGL
jgi:hypothetical protein